MDRTNSKTDTPMAREIHALDCRLRREKNPTKRMQIAKLMELLKINAPAKDIQRQLEVMGQHGSSEV